MEIIVNDVLNQMKHSCTEPDIVHICFTFNTAFHWFVYGFASVPYVCDPRPISQERCLQPPQPCSRGQQ